MTVQVTTALPPTPLPLDTHAKKAQKTKYWQAAIADRLNMAKRETDSLLNNTDIRNIFAEYGYNQSRIEEFAAVYESAVAAQSRQQKEFGDKVGAYADFEKLFITAKDNFRVIKKIAKIALRNNVQKANQLGLNEKYGKSIGSVFDAMQTLYDNAADSTVYTLMTKFGFTENKINDYRAQFVITRNAHNAFIKENSEAVEATVIRDDRMALLDEWMLDFYAIAKIALANRPEFTTAPDENLQ